MKASSRRRHSASRRPTGWGTVVAALMVCAAAPMALRAQSLTTLYSFDSTDGRYVEAGLVQGIDGNLYGTVAKGGNYGWGTVYKLTPAGTLTTLYDFDDTDGGYVTGTLIQANDGNLYGTTIEGGTNSSGTVYKITTGGTHTILYNFCSLSGCSDGKYPSAGLIQGRDGNFYGTTEEGGANGAGTVFKITAGGTLTTLYNFCSQTGCTDGANPHGALIQATNGNLYGTTSGEDNGYGTVFKITSGGTLTTLYHFCSQTGCTDGEHPFAGLIQATDGNLYSTTKEGGTSAGGTVFKITLGGALTTLYSFCSQTGCADGEFPEGLLVQGTDGNLYGTTYQGGSTTNSNCPVGCGVIFSVSTGGAFSTTIAFDYTNGGFPISGLVQDTNGTFYGGTVGGGNSKCYPGCGTVYSLSVGLGAFIETKPTAGKVGASIKILGTNLQSATKVTFNGTAATFKVVSSSLITATVPAGATTGPVKVTLPTGTLTSNVSFQVEP